MKKKILVFCMLLLLSVSLVLANGNHEEEFEEGKRLIESNISCNELDDEQLEAIGEYYMELMHPGEAHETMHKMMGIEEGTEYHKQFHVNIAKMMYCGEGGMMGMMPVMMNMMGGRNMSYGRRGMMGGGMMNMMMNNMMGYGMMGNNPFGYDYSYWGFWNIIWTLFWIGLIVLVIWLIYKFVARKGKTESVVEISKKRYAKGEINKKQFEEMKKELGE